MSTSPTITTPQSSAPSTAPAVIQPPAASMNPPAVQAGSLFDKWHVALVITVLLLLGVVGYKIISAQADRADARFAAAQAVAAASDKTNAAIQQQIVQRLSELANENQRLESQVLTLAQAINKRDSALTVQTASVPRLTPTELGNQWGAVSAEPSPQVDASGAFLVPVPLAQKSVVALMAVPVLQADKKDLQAEVTAKSSIITNDASALSSEKQAHLSDNTTCKADKQVLVAQVDKAKKDARRGKIKVFLYGVGVGAGATVAIVVRYL